MQCLCANSPEPRRRAVTKGRVRTQKSSSYITVYPRLPGLIMGPCPSKESLCCPACPPPFFSRPRSQKLRVSFPCVCSPPVCIIRSVTSLPWLQPHELQSIHHRFLDSLLPEHIIRYHMCPWGRLFPGYFARFFLQRGCCCQGKEVVPVD